MFSKDVQHQKNVFKTIVPPTELLSAHHASSIINTTTHLRGKFLLPSVIISSASFSCHTCYFFELFLKSVCLVFLIPIDTGVIQDD